MKKLFAIIMAMAMLLSLCACGGGKEENPDEPATVVDSDETVKEDDGKKDDKKDDKDIKKGEKFDTINIGQNLGGYCNAFIYRDFETELKGIVSYDGSTDTGAKYYDIKNVGDYHFEVRTKEYGSADDLDAINSVYLVDCYGKKIVSENYAMVEKLSDKYAAFVKVTERTYNKDEASVFLSVDSFVALEPDEDDFLYKSEKYVYDITTGEKVEGIVVTDGSSISVYGDVINYRENGEWIYKNSKGEILPENAYDIGKLEGHYTMEENDVVTVYDAFGKALFTCNEETDYVPTWYDSGYFICMNNSTKKIALFDESGTMISAEIPYDSTTGVSAEIEGDYLIVDCSGKQLYDLKGNYITDIDGTFWYNKENPGYYTITTSDDDMVILDTEGNILFQVKADDTYDVTGDLAYKEINDEEYFFCLKDKDFTLKGEDVYGTNYIEVEHEDDSWEIVDSVTGKTILEGKGDFDCAINGKDVYFCVETEDDVYDFYKV